MRKVLAGLSYHNTDIIFRSKIVLPVEVVYRVTVGGRLKVVVSVTITINTSNSLVNYIPC